MRIIQLPMLPEWRHRAETVNQEKLVHRLFLNHEKVRRVCYWHEENGAVYLDVQMGPSGPLGTWHTYWACYRFEWMRTLHEIRGLYRGAAQAHERMEADFEQQLRVWREQDKLVKKHNWAKEGF